MEGKPKEDLVGLCQRGMESFGVFCDDAQDKEH